MSSTMNRILVLFVATAMMLALLGGCAAPAASQPAATTAAASNSATAAASASATATAQSEEPVELTVVGPWINNAPLGVQTDDIAKELEKRTGVRMNLTSYYAVADINSKIAAMIASDDMPDLTSFGTNELMQSAVTAKVLLPLNDYIAKYGDNLKANVPMMLDYSKNYQSKDKNGNTDGETYVLGGFPVGVFGYDPTKAQVLPYMRWDLYKKAGYPKLDSIDDYFTVMKALLAQNPESRDGKKVYGIGAAFGDGPWAGDYVLWGSIEGEYGDTCNTYANVTAMGTNEYEYWLTDPNSHYFKCAAFWNRCYREGLLDPDSFTMKTDAYYEKVKQGRYVFGWQGSQFDAYNTDSVAKGLTDDYYVQVPPPKDSDGVWISINQPTGTPTNGWGISKKTKYPEKAFKFLDYLASYEGCELLHSGVQGQIWDIVDGKPVIKPDVLNAWMTDPDFMTKTGVGKYFFLALLTPNTTDPKLNTPLNFFLQPEALALKMNPGDKEECAYYGVKVPMDLVTNQTKNIISNAPENLLIPPLPKDLQDMSNNCDKYAFDNYMPMILAKTEADFNAARDKFIAGAKEAGYDTVVKWFTDQRVIAKQKYDSTKQ